MKYFIASDIHGSAYYCDLMLKRFAAEGADRMLLLGDLLYHGPRNDLPRGYNPKAVLAMLNEVAGRIIAVRGNCDSEVDQMVLNFPIMADYAILDLGGVLIAATHGHVFNEENPLKVCRGGVMLCGHFHVPAARRHEDYLYLNAGSVALPKENSAHTYVVFDGARFVWRDIATGADVMSAAI